MHTFSGFLPVPHYKHETRYQGKCFGVLKILYFKKTVVRVYIVSKYPTETRRKQPKFENKRAQPPHMRSFAQPESLLSATQRQPIASDRHRQNVSDDVPSRRHSLAIAATKKNLSILLTRTWGCRGVCCVRVGKASSYEFMPIFENAIRRPYSDPTSLKQ